MSRLALALHAATLIGCVVVAQHRPGTGAIAGVIALVILCARLMPDGERERLKRLATMLREDRDMRRRAASEASAPREIRLPWRRSDMVPPASPDRVIRARDKVRSTEEENE